MEVTVCSNCTASDTAFGFMCHQQSQKDSFYYLVMTPHGQYAIGKSQEGKRDLFLTNNDRWAYSENIAENAPFYRVAADCGGGALALYVDGYPIARVRDSSFLEGPIGLVVWSAEKATRTDLSF